MKRTKTIIIENTETTETNGIIIVKNDPIVITYNEEDKTNKSK